MTYPHFIEVHNGVLPLLVNIDQIKFVCPHPAFLANSEIHYSDGCDEPSIIEESYDEVKQLILDSGCGIAKADPRLDTSHPLTMEDLCRLEMIGEPVWNSNSRRWMLLIDNALDNRSWVDLINDSGKTVRFGPHDVQKFPLYRMREDDEDL